MILLLLLLHLIHLRARTVIMSHHARLLGEGFVAFQQRSIISAVEREWRESEQVRQEADAKEFPLPLS